MAEGAWVLLTYRLPREPSTPRIAVWRSLRRMGAVQLADGLVALPNDARTREQFDWLAEQIEEAGGEAGVWEATPGTGAQRRTLETRMRDAAAAEYRALVADARRAAEHAPGERRRALGRLRRELRRVRRRDFFPPPERAEAERALEALAATLEEVAR
jgi:ChrB-like protein